MAPCGAHDVVSAQRPWVLLQGLRLISNGSLALLLNRNTVTAYNTSTVAPVQQGEGLIFVGAVAYNVTYTVSLDDVEVATFSTPSADADQNEISTSTVASSLTGKQSMALLVTPQPLSSTSSTSSRMTARISNCRWMTAEAQR